MNTGYMDTPIGLLEITEENGCLTRVYLHKGKGLKDDEETPVIIEAKRQLREYFVGKRKAFNLPIMPVGSAFDRAVWQALCSIPYGVLRTYGDLAKMLDRPKASRAVGGGCGRNPLLIIVPCHRVVAADGKLTGFSAGMEAKRFLIAHEGGHIIRDTIQTTMSGQIPNFAQKEPQIPPPNS